MNSKINTPNNGFIYYLILLNRKITLKFSNIKKLESKLTNNEQVYLNIRRGVRIIIRRYN